MPLNTRRTTKKPVQISYLPLSEWSKGLYTRLDRDRIPLNGIASGQNIRISQNGTLGPVPGTSLYGTYQPADGNIIMGQVFEFVKIVSGVPTTFLIWMENRSGVGTVLVNKDGGTPTVVTGKTYAVTGSPHYEQANNRVIITNGVDYLSYMDITTLTITAFSAITSPTTVSATGTGITGTTYTLRYRVAASGAVGETAASAASTVQVSALRENWNGTAQFVTYVWNRVTTGTIPTRYNIYVGDVAGNEIFLDSVADAGSGATQSYVDTGSIEPNVLRVAPAGDSTSGPKFTRTTNVKGQVYGVGDADNPDRIWYDGGSATSNLDFSAFNGGGWVSPNKGGKDFPVKVTAFRDGKGTPMAACLSKGTNGAGKRYLLSPATTTLGSTTISYMSVVEDNGQDGTDAPDSVVSLNDSLIYLSRTGVKISKTSANVQNIISTNGISDNIATDINALDYRILDKAVSVVDDQRVLIALPYQSSTNNQIWTVDFRQGGSWMRPWELAADWLLRYGDNTQGKTIMLALVNNKFVQIDETVNTNNAGTTFQTSISSGEIKFGKNEEWASVIDVTFWFLQPQGDINLSVTASTEDGTIPFNDTMTNQGNQIATAWGRDGWGASGWGEDLTTLMTVNASVQRKKWTIEVGETCQSISWGITTDDTGVDYELSEIIIRYVPIGFLDTDNDA